MGHSIYSFARKGELFNKINKNINNINEVNSKLTRMIITKNSSQLSLYLESLYNENEINLIKSNIKIYKDLFVQNGFERSRFKNIYKIYKMIYEFIFCLKC